MMLMLARITVSSVMATLVVFVSNAMGDQARFIDWIVVYTLVFILSSNCMWGGKS